jgi:hypothetical protein
LGVEGTVVVVAPNGGATPDEWAERTDCPTGPVPRVSPATVDRAAAATAPAATRRLRTKYSIGVAIGAGPTDGAGASGNGCPNVCDANTSSSVA